MFIHHLGSPLVSGANLKRESPSWCFLGTRHSCGDPFCASTEKSVWRASALLRRAIQCMLTPYIACPGGSCGGRRRMPSTMNVFSMYVIVPTERVPVSRSFPIHLLESQGGHKSEPHIYACPGPPDLVSINRKPPSNLWMNCCAALGPPLAILGRKQDTGML